MKSEDFILFEGASYKNRYLALQQKSHDPDELFGELAQKIVDELHPKTVLDVGCNSGLLVQELHNRGVQAWGVDQSSEAIQQAKPEIIPYLQVAPLSAPLLRNYDLIVCLEAVAFAQLEETEKIIENICLHTNDVLFSSTPFFHPDVNPSSVQAPAHWAGVFARHAYYHDLDYASETIAPWCMRFRKTRFSPEEIIAFYETHLWRSRMIVRAGRTLGVETHLELAQRELRLETDLEACRKELETRQKELAEVFSSRTWRLAKFFQNFRLKLAPLGSHREAWIKALISKIRR